MTTKLVWKSVSVSSNKKLSALETAMRADAAKAAESKKQFADALTAAMRGKVAVPKGETIVFSFKFNKVQYSTGPDKAAASAALKDDTLAL